MFLGEFREIDVTMTFLKICLAIFDNFTRKKYAAAKLFIILNKNC